MLAIEGTVVTIDAVGCQRGIAQTIINKKADYVLALKGKQATLRADVDLFARARSASSANSQPGTTPSSLPSSRRNQLTRSPCRLTHP